MQEPNTGYIISYKGDFFWNGKMKKKSESGVDPKLFWTTNFPEAYVFIDEEDARLFSERFFNYPVRIVKTYVD